MNITKEQVDDLNAVLTVKIEEADYQQKVEDVLKDYRRKARVDGFRPGKVPMGMIRKMYYKPVLAEEINRMVGDKLMTYIREEKLRILGEPLPHTDNEKTVDFDNDKEFEFSFDLGLAPEFEMEISENDTIPYYDITVEEKLIDEHTDNVAKRFGDFSPVEKSGGDELIKAGLTELDADGNALEGGITHNEVSMSLDMMKDEEQKKLFIGCKVGDKVIFNVKKAYPNTTEISSLLGITKEEAEAISGDFEADILEVLMFEKHEVNQELFDKVYGEGAVNGEEEFRAKLKEELKSNYERESDYKFALDAKDYLIKKADLNLPAEFLKRWLTEANENIDREKIDSEFGEYENEFRWQLIKDKIIRKYEIKVSQEELFEYAMILSRNQFYQYGLYNVQDEHLENFAREQLNKPEEARRLSEQKYEDKVISYVKDNVKLDKKETDPEKFKKLFEN